MAGILTERLTKQFNGVTAVDAVDLDIAEGEIFGLVGPDGAGKTTLIRLISTILLATSGDAKVGGYSVTTEPHRVRPLIGYMSQRFTLYADLTVLENLRFFGELHGLPARRQSEKIDALLEFSRLTDFIDRPAGQLSGGMKQKLALACTLIHEPKLLLLDELTTGVDPVSRREFWKILADLHHQGTTVFVATPYMDEAERCGRVAFMRNGRIILCDSPRNIKSAIPGRVVAVTAGDIYGAAAALRAIDLRVDIYGSALHVYLDDAKDADPIVRRRLEDAGIRIESLAPARLSMENAFAYLTGVPMGAEAGAEAGAPDV